jgi:hypothetical protein
MVTWFPPLADWKDLYVFNMASGTWASAGTSFEEQRVL